MMKQIRPWGRRFLQKAAASLVLAAAGWWLLPWAAPLPPRLLTPLPLSATFVAADGSSLRRMLSTEGNRTAGFTALAEIPPDFIHATLAAEDKRFFAHRGLDIQAIARAAWDNCTRGRVVSGASTITQQLVKITAEDPPSRSLWRKLKQALQARHLEMIWSKERILAEYLNRVGYGNLLTGCTSAAQGYFDKPLRDLTPAECAFLAAIPQAPSRLNPLRDPKAVELRKRLVLDRMAACGWLTPEARAIALAEKHRLQPFNGGFAAPHAIELITASPASSIIRTTIDRPLQAYVESAITLRLDALRDRHVTQAAAVVIENRTGRVLALAGSRGFFDSEGGQVNGAWAPHSAGSAVKPFTYLLALERGATPATVIPDLPVEFATVTGIYRPENYDHRTHGPVSLRMALGSSLNIPAVRALKQLGGEQVLCHALKQLGLTTLAEPAEHYGLGLTVGNAPVRLIELANAYACLARLGEYKPWTLLGQGAATESRRLFSEEACYLIAHILSDNQARIPAFGPNSVIRLPFPCAVKTGTSRNYRDNWTLGYTPEFTVGVWAGNFDNTPMEDVSGVSGAGPILRDIFIRLSETTRPTWFSEPSALVHAKVDTRTGHRLPFNAEVVHFTRDEIFLPTTLPAAASPADYDPATGRAYLGPEYAAWLAKGDSWLADSVCLRPETAAPQPPVIAAPASGLVIFLDANLRDGGRRLMLQARSAAAVRWSSPTLRIEQDSGADIAWLEPGKHVIIATDELSGLQTAANIEVRSSSRFARR